MRTWQAEVGGSGGGMGVPLRAGDRAELLIVDLSLARTLFGGVPAARLLARMRIASDEKDAAAQPAKLGASAWEAGIARILGGSSAAERVKRAIARHTRDGVDEGPLRVDDQSTATLLFAVAIAPDVDASPAEIFAERPRADATVESYDEREIARACATYEPRLASGEADRRAVLFESCVRLTTRGSAGPWPVERITEAMSDLAGSELKLELFRRSSAALFPLAFDSEIATVHRRMTLLERAQLDSVVRKDPRELASAIARSERDLPAQTHLDTLIADLTTLLAHPGELVVAIPPPEMEIEVHATPIPTMRPSWLPTDWGSHTALAALADAVERGTTTLPRLHGLVGRAGEPALDAIGAEMLRAIAHPFASAAFAEVLARSGRPRDVMRLVTYFAIAPDPDAAARALSTCVAPELPAVLRAWLEAMLPSDGALVPFGENPETSSAARVTACVAALAPYPRLYGAVRPLLARVTEAPPPRGNEGSDSV